MDIREALYTTRAMRRVKPDPIPMDVQARIMDAAVRAPSGGNTQNWRFLLVDDPEVKAKLGPIYRQAMSVLWGSYYKDRLDAAHDAPELEESKSMLRVQKSAQWLADNFEMVPLYMFGFAQHDPSGSSVYPALWNSRRFSCFTTTRCSTSSAFRRTKVGTCSGACHSVIRPASGVLPRVSPRTMSRSAISGAKTSASATTNRSGRN